MRFQQNDVAKWTRLSPLKSLAHASEVVHHNTLNARDPHREEMERSREVERFFDLMTPTPRVLGSGGQGTPR